MFLHMTYHTCSNKYGVCLFVHVCICVYLAMYVSICLSICLSNCLCVCVCVRACMRVFVRIICVKDFGTRNAERDSH